MNVVRALLGVLDCQRAAVGVITREQRHLAEGVRDPGQIAPYVISEDGPISTRIGRGQNLARAIVRVRARAGQARRSQGLRQQIPMTVVDVAGHPARFRDPYRQAKDWMPCGRRGRRLRRADTVRARGFEIARRVISPRGRVPVAIQFLDDIAVDVVIRRDLTDGPNPAGAAKGLKVPLLGRSIQSVEPMDLQRSERVRHTDRANVSIGVIDRKEIDAAGVLTRNGPALRIVSKTCKARAEFVDDACEIVRKGNALIDIFSNRIVGCASR